MITKNGDTPALWRWLLAAAAVSFIPSLFFPYVGEEGVYTITTLEMWHGHLWANPVLYGNAYGRPPFLNWVMLPFVMAFGPARVLVVSRLVAALATLLTAAGVFGFTRILGASRRAAWLTLLVFLSSDALLYHGWLAYSDPLFSLLTFGGMACVFVAAKCKRAAPLGMAMVLVTAAFLTKALTAYLFVASTWVVVFIRHRDARSTLLKPSAIVYYLAGVLSPLAWFHLTGNASPGGEHEGGAMVGDILNRLLPGGPVDLVKHMVAFPVETFCRFLPVSAIVGYAVLRRESRASETSGWATTISIVTALNFVPYWISPQGSIRYILPLYPFIAFLIAYKLETLEERMIRIAVYCVAAVIALKFVALVVFPHIQEKQRGDAAAVAKSIISIVGTDRIYTDDPSSAGLSVASYIDARRWPAAPLAWIPAELPDGWLFTRIAERRGTAVVWMGSLGKERMYLLCSGRACASASARANRPAIVDASSREVSGNAH